jgi:hypothetical protein
MSAANEYNHLYHSISDSRTTAPVSRNSQGRCVFSQQIFQIGKDLIAVAYQGEQNFGVEAFGWAFWCSTPFGISDEVTITKSVNQLQLGVLNAFRHLR